MGLSLTRLLLLILSDQKAKGIDRLFRSLQSLLRDLWQLWDSCQCLQLTRNWTMAHCRKMDIINATAMPMIPVEESLAVSFCVQNVTKTAVRKDLENSVPSCIIGSMDQVSERIAEVYPNPQVGILAMERYEMEKKAVREKSHGVPGDRDKIMESKVKPCSGSESKNAKAFILKRKTAAKNLLAELYQYPEFNSSRPNELPNGVEFCDMVSNVIRAEKNPLTGKSFCVSNELRKFLSSPFPRAMFLDSFWWIFHERYQPNKELQKKLFDRIAINYANLLCSEFRSYYKEALLKRWPSLLSKGLYTSFCSCFPQSWFNTPEFKTEICNTLSLWFTGIYPCPQSYNNWNYAELDPEGFRREELMLQRKRMAKGKGFSLVFNKRLSSLKIACAKKFHHTQSSYMSDMASSFKKNLERHSQVQKTMKEFYYQTMNMRRPTNQVKKLSEARQLEALLPKQSHPASKSPEMVPNHFNIYGKSPLIVYFLHNYLVLRQRGQDVLMVRREKTKSIRFFYAIFDQMFSNGTGCNFYGGGFPGFFPVELLITESTLKYADIISQVLSNMKKRKERLCRLTWLHWNEWNYFDEYLKEQQEYFLREVRNINQQEAEKKKANHTFIPPSTLNDECLDTKHNRSQQKEAKLPLRKEEEEEKEKKRGVRGAPFVPSRLEDPGDLATAARDKKTTKKLKPMQKKGTPSFPLSFQLARRNPGLRMEEAL